MTRQDMGMDRETALELIQSPDRSAAERRDALSWLLARKALKDAQPSLEGALLAWRKTAADPALPDSELFTAVSEIVRIGASNPGVAKQSDETLRDVFKRPLPPLDSEADGDTRVNVAKGLKRIAPGWSVSYALDALATEDKSDRVRSDLVELLVSTNASLASVLEGLSSRFEKRTPEVEAGAKAQARRAVRVIEILRSSFATSDIEAGPDVGEAFDRFVRMAMRPFGSKVDPKSAEEMAAQAVRFVQTVIRSRFSLALEPGTYAAVRRAAGFFDRGKWPKKLQPVLGVLARDVAEAIVLLGRQGVENKPLLDQLVVVSGSRDEAKRKTEKLVAEHPELPEKIKFFLTHWQVRAGGAQDSEEVQEAILNQVDSAIADALVEAERMRRAFVDEGAGSEDVAAIIRRVDKAITELAKRRRIEFYGEIGRVMNASPKYFQSQSGAVEGIVRRPAVVRTRDDGTPGACLVQGVLE